MGLISPSILIFLVGLSTVDAGSPVQKVVELLGECKQKVLNDLEEEKKSMTEFTAYCDNEAKEKGYDPKGWGKGKHYEDPWFEPKGWGKGKDDWGKGDGWGKGKDDWSKGKDWAPKGKDKGTQVNVLEIVQTVRVAKNDMCASFTIQDRPTKLPVLLECTVTN